MLETMGQFGLQYSDHAQGTLGSLAATPSLLGKVIELQGQDVEVLFHQEPGTVRYRWRRLGHALRW